MATLRAHDLPVQTQRIQITKLKNQVFGNSLEKIERETSAPGEDMGEEGPDLDLYA